MPYTTAGNNLMLDALRGTNPTVGLAYASLHTASPGESGTSEVTGGSPAYARKAITMAAAASDDWGSRTYTPESASTTVQEVALKSATT